MDMGLHVNWPEMMSSSIISFESMLKIAGTDAPRALRIPISLVLCSVLYRASPKSPIQAMTMARIAITIIVIGTFVYDFSRYKSGGLWGHGKKRWEIGLTGALILLFYVIFMAIWGGIFWW